MWCMWKAKVQISLDAVFDQGLCCQVTELLDTAYYTDHRDWPERVDVKIDLPASVAQLDARLTGDQEVVGSTHAEVGNILS